MARPVVSSREPLKADPWTVHGPSGTAVVNQATLRCLAPVGFHPRAYGSGLRAPLAIQAHEQARSFAGMISKSNEPEPSRGHLRFETVVLVCNLI
ncbi:hypothetical protein ALP66_02002 [Pseudomonas amygdali pv. photiniae]|uniref:Uncharacterized protein n=1 Tax=Pseudomonas amygdali pv. photiniae TaxID=251724 RepID=A0A658K8S2_PSEA0|nr:hypothetical protein ALP66_02002 [Pseudomonas amygdali pv. photiniae]